MPGKELRFRIALSFPGEHRPFVKEVAAVLAKHLGQDRVLYDAYYEAEFARLDIASYLQRLYHSESELIAVFLSAAYQQKEWCGLEWRAIQDVIKQRRAESVMPFRFDMTEIPGLFSTDGYVWVGDRQPQEIAGLILQRLGQPRIPAPLPSPPGTSQVGTSTALPRWQQKLAYLLEQEPLTVDPDQKFRLQHLIAEARAKVREHGGSA